VVCFQSKGIGVSKCLLRSLLKTIFRVTTNDQISKKIKMYKAGLFLIFLWVQLCLFAQKDSSKVVINDSTLYRIIKTDGDELIGYILEQNSREIRCYTNDRREIIVPQFVVSRIEKIDPKDLGKRGEYIGEDRFSTRYFITTNGLPIKKGEHYMQWNLYGPDFQFAVGENLGVGIMTSWLATPIVGTLKYSLNSDEKVQFAVGTLVGSSSWMALSDNELNFGGVLPFATLSTGNRQANAAFSGGYGLTWMGSEYSGRALASVAGMVKVSKRISLVFDSFLIFRGKTKISSEWRSEYNPSTGQWVTVMVPRLERKPGIYLLIPGIRWHQTDKKAFQFGFLGIYSDGEFLPMPVPMVQWYRNL
jgi:hypothetical protein